MAGTLRGRSLIPTPAVGTERNGTRLFALVRSVPTFASTQNRGPRRPNHYALLTFLVFLCLLRALVLPVTWKTRNNSHRRKVDQRVYFRALYFILQVTLSFNALRVPGYNWSTWWNYALAHHFSENSAQRTTNKKRCAACRTCVLDPRTFFRRKRKKMCGP